MKYLQPAAVFLLMASVGMSISLPQFTANWRRLTPRSWLKLLAATFLLPPLLALALGPPLITRSVSGQHLQAQRAVPRY